MSNSYGWDEILPETIPEVDWSQFTKEQMLGICEMLDTHVSMSDEVYSYSVPSQSDMEESRWHRKEQSLVAEHQFQTDWRDKRIKDLENKVEELWRRIDRLG